MKGLTYFLKDTAMLFAVFLILSWTGAKFEWFHWLIVAIAMIAMGSMWANRAISFTVNWFAEQTKCNNPECKACAK